MASTEKRCLYEVLGLSRDCAAYEIRSAYRKLALQRNPDKLIKSGVSEAEATASFQELVNAYEVLSDAREREWYDSHRSQILFSTSNPNNSSSASAIVPDLFSFFSNSVYSGYSDKGKGFYKVYSDVFDKIYQNELNFAKKLGLGNVVKEAPLMGNLDSPYAQVNAFYGYWLGFVTVMDFVWADQYDAMAGPNRKSRRMMEEENKKIRKKARREYNDTVRGLAEFVKKRDKRVIDMQVKRNEDMERKKEEERARKKKLEKEKTERAKAYEEPEWAKVEDEELVEDEEDEMKSELYCVACKKKFKSDKQWKNHEKSKKHKEKVAELRKAFREEDRENEDHGTSDGDVFVSADDGIDKLKNQIEGAKINTEDKDHYQESQLTEDEIVDIDNLGSEGPKGVAKELGLDDDDNEEDETSASEAILSGYKSGRNVGSMRKPKASKKVHVDDESEEIDLMEYNNKARRKRGGRKEKGKRADEVEEQIVDKPEIRHTAGQESGCDDAENDDNEPPGKINFSKQAPQKKVTNKKDLHAKSKNASIGKKQKATSKNSSHECDTCGLDFESRNKLYKHLCDTGHATLKSR